MFDIVVAPLAFHVNKLYPCVGAEGRLEFRTFTKVIPASTRNCVRFGLGNLEVSGFFYCLNLGLTVQQFHILSPQTLYNGPPLEITTGIKIKSEPSKNVCNCPFISSITNYMVICINKLLSIRS